MTKALEMVNEVLKELKESFGIEVEGVSVRHDKGIFYTLTVRDKGGRYAEISIDNDGYDDYCIYDATVDLYMKLRPECVQKATPTRTIIMY